MSNKYTYVVDHGPDYPRISTSSSLMGGAIIAVESGDCVEDKAIIEALLNTILETTTCAETVSLITTWKFGPME